MSEIRYIPGRGYWALRNCTICGKEFEYRHHPRRLKKLRTTCSQECSRLYKDTCHIYRKKLELYEHV